MRLVKERFHDGRSLKITFHSVIIDEAHFVKNGMSIITSIKKILYYFIPVFFQKAKSHFNMFAVLAFWGMGTALLGAQSKRIALLTGTPYNNGPRDMSALMTYIDPTHESACIKWWEKATAKGSKQEVVRAVSNWRKGFI